MQINFDEEGRSGISTVTHIDISSVLSLKVNKMKQKKNEIKQVSISRLQLNLLHFPV